MGWAVLVTAQVGASAEQKSPEGASQTHPTDLRHRGTRRVVGKRSVRQRGPSDKTRTRTRHGLECKKRNHKPPGRHQRKPRWPSGEGFVDARPKLEPGEQADALRFLNGNDGGSAPSAAAAAGEELQAEKQRQEPRTPVSPSPPHLGGTARGEQDGRVPTATRGEPRERYRASALPRVRPRVPPCAPAPPEQHSERRGACQPAFPECGSGSRGARHHPRPVRRPEGAGRALAVPAAAVSGTPNASLLRGHVPTCPEDVQVQADGRLLTNH